MSTIRVTVRWKDLPEGVTAYHTLHAQERAVRRQRLDLDTMIVSRARPYGEHHWDDQNRIMYCYLQNPEIETVEVDAVCG